MKLFFCLIFLFVNSYAAKTKLKKYNIDPAGVNAIGLSSGAFMTVQMHVAFSNTIKGAGVIAGGPYYCAQGIMTTAVTSCMSIPSGINVNYLIQTTDTWAAANLIDPTSNLKNSPVYLFHGGSGDTTVYRGVEDKLNLFYQHYGADIKYKTDLKAGHGFITQHYGIPCTQSKTPYINNCGFDLAGDIFEKLYGDINFKSPILGGSYVEVDQSEFWDGGKAHGLHDSAWLYVPEDCQSGEVTCKLAVVFHGCLQNYNYVRDVMIKNAGFNNWADSNNIIVLYPQTGNGATNGCWDWWGDQGDRPEYVQRKGHQMSTMKRMLDRILFGSGQ